MDLLTESEAEQSDANMAELSSSEGEDQTSESEEQASHSAGPVRAARCQTRSKSDGKNAMSRVSSPQSDADMAEPSTSESEGQASGGRRTVRIARTPTMLNRSDAEKANGRVRWPSEDTSSYTAGSPSPGKTRDADPMDGSSNLNPKAIESNQEPSLVSDDGDDEYFVIPDSEDSNSNRSETDDCDDRHFGQITVQDDEMPTISDTKRDPEFANTATNRAPSLSKPITRSSMRNKGREGLSAAERRRLVLQNNRVRSVGPDSGPSRFLRSSRHLRSSSRHLE